MAKDLANNINGSGKKLQSRIWFFSLVESENDIPAILERMKESNAVQVFAIRHDKDKIRQDDGSIVPKKPHYHFAVRYDNPTVLSTLANICLLDPGEWNLVQKSKNWRSSLRYMLHLDSRDKHLYPIEELQVIKGTKDDYFNTAIGKSQVVTTDADLFPWFGNFDEVPYKSQYRQIYDNIDDTRRRNILLKELQVSWNNYLTKRKFEMESKNVKVIFIEGAPGSGKSTFAKQLAIDNKKTYVVSSSSNDVLQDYTCEDFLILDDLRDDVFTFADLLKLLDNFVISTVKSRYQNKLFLGDTIVITSAKPLCEWYRNTDEDRTQLFRRINMFARCHRNGNSLVADLFIPLPGQSMIDDNGNPQGNIISMPILDLTPEQVNSVEMFWKSLGVNVEDLAKTIVPGADPVQLTIDGIPNTTKKNGVQ